MSSTLRKLPRSHTQHRHLLRAEVVALPCKCRASRRPPSHCHSQMHTPHLPFIPSQHSKQAILITHPHRSSTSRTHKLRNTMLPPIRPLLRIHIRSRTIRVDQQVRQLPNRVAEFSTTARSLPSTQSLVSRWKISLEEMVRQYPWSCISAYRRSICLDLKWRAFIAYLAPLPISNR